jgi:hypothetical protein
MKAAMAQVRPQTLISILISMVISAGLFLAVFGPAQRIAVRTLDGLAVDLVPQTLGAGFMAALMPALVVRAQQKRLPLASAIPSVAAIIRRALALAVLGLGLAAIVMAMLWFGPWSTLAWSAAFALKVGYGGLIGLIITPAALRPFAKGV